MDYSKPFNDSASSITKNSAGRIKRFAQYQPEYSQSKAPLEPAGNLGSQKIPHSVSFLNDLEVEKCSILGTTKVFEVAAQVREYVHELADVQLATLNNYLQEKAHSGLKANFVISDESARSTEANAIGAFTWNSTSENLRRRLVPTTASCYDQPATGFLHKCECRSFRELWQPDANPCDSTSNIDTPRVSVAF
jgi:hypothetical protein